VFSLSLHHLKLLAGHRQLPFFTKYQRLVRYLLEKKLLVKEDFVWINEPIARRRILAVHSSSYLDSIEEAVFVGMYPVDEVFMDDRLFHIVKLFCRGTYQAARSALSNRYAMFLGGGFHHAGRDRAGGFCVLNDVAIAIQGLLDAGEIDSALVIDLDIHQGDGTARIFSTNPNVFTFSIHQDDNYPREKARSSLDVSLHSTDASPKVYLFNLKYTISRILSQHAFDIMVYIAGSDALIGDVNGGFGFSLKDLEKRDRLVVNFARREHIPLVVLMGGGYNEDMGREVRAYSNTLHILKESFA